MTLKIKKLLSLTKKELKSYQDARNCHIVEKESYKNSLKVKIVKKLGITGIIPVNIETQHILFVNLDSMCPMKSR